VRWKGDGGDHRTIRGEGIVSHLDRVPQDVGNLISVEHFRTEALQTSHLASARHDLTVPVEGPCAWRQKNKKAWCLPFVGHDAGRRED
jgi:hypothetical protein